MELYASVGVGKHDTVRVNYHICFAYFKQTNHHGAQRKGSWDGRVAAGEVQTQGTHADHTVQNGKLKLLCLLLGLTSLRQAFLCKVSSKLNVCKENLIWTVCNGM